MCYGGKQKAGDPGLWAMGLWVVAVGMALVQAAPARAYNRIDWEPFKVAGTSQDGYVAMISVEMDPYGVTNAFIQAPGTTNWQGLIWQAPRQRWYWQSPVSPAPSFDGQWGLRIIDSNAQTWDFSYVVHPMTISDFPSTVHITAPATQYQTIPSDYTFGWNPDGADLEANRLLMQFVNDTYGVVDFPPLSATQWSPGPLPPGDAVFSMAYSFDAPDKLSDFTLLSGQEEPLPPLVTSSLLSTDVRHLTVAPEPPTLSLLVLSGNWSDASCWTAGVPLGGMQAAINSGGQVTISQGVATCSGLVLGSDPADSGTVQMTGGRLDANWVTIGLRGTGTFIQSGGDHHVRQVLSIGAESNSSGIYTLQGGNLFAGNIVVGGSTSQKGGIGTLTISGGNAIVDGTLRIWSGSTVNLGFGGMVSSDANHPALDLYNDGTVEVGDANGDPVVYCFRDITGDGSIVIGAGATVWVESLGDNSAWVNTGGRLILSYENPQLYAATAMRNYEAAVPEPATLCLIVVGGLAMLSHRQRKLASTALAENRRRA